MAGAAMPMPRAAATHLLNILGLGERITYSRQALRRREAKGRDCPRTGASTPAVVLADGKPTAALDGHSSLLVVRMLKALGRERGVTTLMVTTTTASTSLRTRFYSSGTDG